MTRTLFTGVGVALVTLFDEAGAVDLAATAKHARRLADLGVRCVVTAGTTGEAATLGAQERTALLAEVRQALPGDVPVLAGTGAASSRQAVELTRQARTHGADGVLVLSPPGVADPRPYYRAVAAAADGLPVLGYHFPLVSSPGIPVDHLAELPVDGLKDSSADAERLLVELDRFAGALYVGSSPLLSFAGPLGCQGAILALANAEPERCTAAFAGDAAAQRALLGAHLAAQRDFPHGLKRLVAERFGTATAARLG